MAFFMVQSLGFDIMQKILAMKILTHPDNLHAIILPMPIIQSKITALLLASTGHTTQWRLWRMSTNKK